MTCIVTTTRLLRVAALAAACACVCATTVVASGCGKKKKDAGAVQAERAHAAASVEGLDALPADAHVVVGANVKRLAASPLVQRAFARMLARDAGVAARLGDLQTRCKLDPGKDLDTVLVGLMGTTDARDVVLVAKGRFDEASIATCVEGALTDRGGSLEKKPAAGVTLYLTHNPQGGGDVAFTFGAKDVLIIADSEALLLRSRDPAAAKLKSNAAMMALLAQTDTHAALWGAGQIAPEVGRGLVDAAAGKVKQPAKAIWGLVNLDAGLAVELALELDSEADAKGLNEVVQKQLAQYSIVAQAYSLGAIVNKIKPEARGHLFVVTLTLDAAELTKLESLLDRNQQRGPSGDSEGKEGTSP